MKNFTFKNELFQASHMMILICYSIFSLILVGESLLLSWEKWALIPIVAALIGSWVLHMMQILSERARIWVYSLLMMVTAFFYGIHLTSTYDLALVISGVIMIYTMTGIPSLITLWQISYYITMGYDIIIMTGNGTKLDSLFITRTLLHISMIFMIGFISRTIIKKWQQVLVGSSQEIKRLEDVATRMNDFLANMSHEIRTPINAVIGLTGVCIHKETSEEVKKDLLSVESAGKRVAEQISDILDFSEIDMGNLAVNTEDYMLSSVLNDLVTQVRPAIRPELELIIDVDPELPEIMNSDVGKLKKILWHLIMNGLKYTKEGGVYVRLSSVKETYGINLCMEVRDTGIGMNAEELEKICEGFYQANSGRSRSTNGLGLGMAIVSGFVKVLGGFMTIESKPDAGTTVRVSLPQQVIDDSVCMSVNDRAKLVLGSFLNFGKYDSPQVREFYDAMLRDIVSGLGVEMHKVESMGNLQKLVSSTRMTHLFVGPEEYEVGKDYIESLTKDMIVVVVAKDDFEPAKNSRVKILRKPFYCFPVISILNMDVNWDKDEEGQLMCPGVHALVVDDEPMNLTVANGIFKRYGMQISTAANGPDAIHMCKDNEYDIVFMDHMMPGMDGVEAMKRIRTECQRARREMPIVALTANAVSTAREMFISEGFDGFVSKPIDLTELERVMRRVLPKSKIEIVATGESTQEIATQQEKGIESDTTIEEDVMEFSPQEEEVMEFSPDVDVEEQPAGNPEDELLWDGLKELKIDYVSGLHYCKEDTELFKMLLLQFADEEVTKERDTDRFLAEGKLPDYGILVHAIKSTSKLIGAMELSEEARALEFAAKDQDGDFVKANHRNLILHYRDLAANIRRLLNAGEEEAQDGMSSDDDVFEFEPEVE
ncbi:MAG: response regulator [Lachnospiraceae bacterium]|jgi:signal transduction histidine kinase/DNA-binding response OmpR family regulator/HPt (histidine-containing phosphotransfer) domain-containing protein|nr:response regulator [Lachnospiraceae bacterium]